MSNTQPDRKSWLVFAILAGVAYAIIGRFFPNPDSSAGAQVQLLWRLGAWVLSAAVFAFHIGYEHFRFRNSPLTVAAQTTSAVALGAFLLALFATVRAVTNVTHAPFRQYLLALVLWPIFTAIPAFVVSFVIAFVLTRFSPRFEVSTTSR